MRNKTKIKLLISLMLMATPISAQPNPDTKKCEWRARDFAKFLLYWCERTAVESATKREIRIAEKTPYDVAAASIPQMTRDSTYMANLIAADANIINKKYSLKETPEYVYTWYDLMYSYERRDANKNSEEYLLAEKLLKYIDLMKQIKLARYTIQVNQK